ncbi:MAG: MarR family transcriptional regulator [Planctomycetota bacterium]
MNASLEQGSPTLGPVLDFLRVIWELDHALQRRSKRMARDIGVTGPQRLVLQIVGRFPGLPAGELAALLHVHPGTLTGVLQRLEKKGWIRRRADPKDRRRTLVGLTERGRAFDSADAITIESALRAVLARSDAGSAASARILLQALSRELESPRAQAPGSGALTRRNTKRW